MRKWLHDRFGWHSMFHRIGESYPCVEEDRYTRNMVDLYRCRFCGWMEMRESPDA